MKHGLLFASALVLGAGYASLAGAPAAAQTKYSTKIVYGDEPCPTSPDGDEIVVCRRLPLTEKFRIPKEFRKTENTPANESWGSRVQSLQSVGNTGTGSCSAVGGGGWAGCWREQMKQAKADRKQQGEPSGLGAIIP
ncbi:hypothetical protein [Flavisphingomonas formosensis]|uniref:hypothetical protein n=1 Tax=Flavisphingomonas formosensis TaxID=861534 RepID=UPI0012FA00BE|nr:hypothetical protein [Sphingomonas formosensis]